MKALLFALVTSTMLYSCGPDHKIVRLPNGALVDVVNKTDIHYTIGSSVCITRSSLADWEICNDGEMIDTIYARSYTTANGISRKNIITHKLGKISTR